MKARLKRPAGRIATVLALGLFLFTPAMPVLAGAWIQTTSLPDGYYAQALVYASGFLYQTGGENTSGGYYGSPNVFYAQVNSDGTIGTWNSTTPLPEYIFYHASVAANGFVYVLGGYDFYGYDNYSSSVYYAKINPDGSLGSWQSANPMPSTLAEFSATVWNNRIYVMGGVYGQMNAQPLAINVVYSAAVQTDGSLSAWTSETPLPQALFDHAAAANGYLYVAGGVSSEESPTNTVYFTKINPDGSLAGWNETTPLPQTESRLGLVAANGFVFTVAGHAGDGTDGGSFVTTVNGDGSLGSWSSGTSLPQSLYQAGVAAAGSYLFVSGGQNASDANSSNVYSLALPLPPAAPALVAQPFTNGNFQVQLTSAANTGFGILVSTNLTTWTPLGSGFTDANGALLFQDTNAAGFPHRFYRAYWPLP